MTGNTVGGPRRIDLREVSHRTISSPTELARNKKASRKLHLRDALDEMPESVSAVFEGVLHHLPPGPWLASCRLRSPQALAGLGGHRG